MEIIFSILLIINHKIMHSIEGICEVALMVKFVVSNTVIINICFDDKLR